MCLRILAFAAAASFLLLAACGKQSISSAADFYVSPKGDDANAGTKDAPFRTLARARDAVREGRLSAPAKNYEVELADGTYFLNEPLRFDLSNSAAEGFSTTFRAANIGGAVLESGVEISGWKKCSILPKGAALSGGLWEADVSELLLMKAKSAGTKAAPQINMLFRNGKALPRAKSFRFSVKDGVKLEKLAQMSKVSASPPPRYDQRKVVIPPEFDCDFDALEGAQVWLIPSGPWVLNIMPVKSADAESRTLSTSLPCAYEPVAHSRNFANAWLVNYAPALKNDGDWIFSEKEKKIYMVSEGEPRGVSVPVLTRLVEISGKLGGPSEEDVPVNGIRFKGVKFARTDYSGYDQSPNYAVMISGAKACSFEDCTFEALGGGGVKMDLCALENAVKNCLFSDIGGAGAYMRGYGPGKKRLMRGNIVENCIFRRCGRVFMQYGAVCSQMGTENSVRNCTIYDMHYNGVSFSGSAGVSANAKYPNVIWDDIDPKFRETGLYYPDTIPYLGGGNAVESCEFLRTGETLGDSNAVYFWSGGLGDKIIGNFVHGLRGWYCNASIRMDDNQTGAMISHNITYDNIGLGVISKGANSIVNNFFVETRIGRYNSAEVMNGAIGVSIRGGYPAESVVERNIIVLAADGEPKPLQLYLYAKKRWPFDPERVSMDRNLLWTLGADQSATRKNLGEFQGKHGWNAHSLVADPMFKNPSAHDFSFPKNSPATSLGIDQIDVSKAGVQGEMRRREMKPRIAAPKIEAVNFERPEFEAVHFPHAAGMRVKASLPKGAEELRYTLNGETPDENSPILKPDSEFEITEPCVFTVRAFSKNGEDLLGDRIIFNIPIPGAVQKK